MNIFRRFSTMSLKEFADVPCEVAVVGMGCFWGVDSLYGIQKGVLRTCCGYAGGKTTDPTYHDLENHTEVVKIEYDPTVIGYEKIIDLFFEKHNPTDKYKAQYMSVIFCEDAKQKEIAQQKLTEAKAKFSKPVVTQIRDKVPFYPAELYHQKYRLQCNDKVMKLAKKAGVKDVISSHVAARLNGYLGGQGSLEQFESEDLGMTPELISSMIEIIKRGVNVSCH